MLGQKVASDPGAPLRFFSPGFHDSPADDGRGEKFPENGETFPAEILR